jgi:hypothetical protein
MVDYLRLLGVELRVLELVVLVCLGVWVVHYLRLLYHRMMHNSLRLLL